jgi:colanic acid/amylovoran biosynthesis glycosyltransferase
MRLAYLTSQYPAASHTFIRREVEAMRELGVDVDTFSVRAPSADETVSELDRLEAERTYYLLRQSLLSFVAAHAAALFTHPIAYAKTFGRSLSHRAPGARGLFLGLAHFAESIVLARELKRRGTTQLHNHFANSAATVGLLATRFLGIGWSFTMHGISETDYPAGLMLGRKIEAARLVACVSWFGRAQGMRLVEPSHWQKMHVVRCGLPFDRLPARAAGSTEVQTIVCVGRLSPEKGQAGLLRVFAQLLKDRANLRLRLVGDGPERGNLEALADKLGVGASMIFAGRLSEEDTLREIARSDLLVLPSFMEGLPIVLMEAMALGVPVIASGVAGIPELVEDEVTGLLFAPSNWDDLQSQIERLISDRTLYDAVAKRGRDRVAGEFDTRKSATKLSRLFREAGQAKLPKS